MQRGVFVWMHLHVDSCILPDVACTDCQAQPSLTSHSLLLRLPPKTPLPPSRLALQANAPAALSILHKKVAEQAELSELTTSVRTRLGLRRLLKDEVISMQDFRNACKRLLINREALLQANIEGLSIRVSDKNRVASDGSLVDIAWDFDM